MIQPEQEFESLIPVMRTFTSAAQQFAWRQPGMLVVAQGLNWNDAAGESVQFYARFYLPALSLGIKAFVNVDRDAVFSDPDRMKNSIYHAMRNAEYELDAKIKEALQLKQQFTEELHYALHLR